MKHLVLEKTKYILTNSWLGLLLPAGVHQLLSLTDRQAEKQSSSFRNHPAESRLSRSAGAKSRP
ncbi:MAG: hypothetical protein J7497_00590 [Chitinophagaceae bacterium]|nr:hypothetical protein [Chitinophagaceae bacterium]